MPELWCPHAVKLPFKGNGAGSFIPATPRGVLHTTEANTYRPSRTSYYGHNNPPHFTVTRDGIAYQHYPITLAARALRHPRGTPQTNRMNAYQIEIVGYAARIRDMPQPQFLKLRRVMRWIEGTVGVDRMAPFGFYGSEAYGEGSVARMTDAQWRSVRGWVGHQHVPDNAHWDPGLIDIGRLLTMAWQAPGDPVETISDARAVANYQGGSRQVQLIDGMDEPAGIAYGRTLDMLMQHDLRLRKGKL